MNSPPDREFVAVEWAERAACRGLIPATFYPDIGKSSAAALRVCQTCVVRSACLEHAIETRETHGVWGGMTANQRRTEYRRRNLTKRKPINHGSPWGARAHLNRDEQPCDPCLKAAADYGAAQYQKRARRTP
jgi:WhiB family redox-sensing transcriptional regulator|tara:strand:+ start:3607 stop:4002 length:396 start_codon:yes stop_codon:yes gene_type:complete